MPTDHLKEHGEDLAERYLLQEMSPEEAENFERHFFECEECASAVEAGQILRANGRAVMVEGWAPAAQKQSWLERFTNWLSKSYVMIPATAALLLGAVAVYQGTVTIPRLREARVLPAFQLIGASRGAAAQISVPKDASSFAIAADVPPDAKFANFICELSSEGRIVFQLPAMAPAAGQPITILVPAQDLHSGQFQLTVFGAGSDGQKMDKVSTFSFDFRRVQ